MKLKLEAMVPVAIGLQLLFALLTWGIAATARGEDAKPASSLPTADDRLAHMELVATYQNLEAVIQRGRADIAESQPRQKAILARLETMLKAMNQKAGCRLKPDLRACEEATPAPVSAAPAKPPAPTTAKAGTK